MTPNLSSLGTPLQGVSAAMIFAFGTVLIWYIRGWPDRKRAANETTALTAKIEEDLRGEAAERFREFRTEVHALRNELAKARAELDRAAAKSMRRGDKLNMMRFILMMVIDELAAKDPQNRVLAQAHQLLSRIEEEPHQVDNSDALAAAEDTVDAAQATVRQVKAEEAKKK
jgi:hypothetical protein